MISWRIDAHLLSLLDTFTLCEKLVRDTVTILVTRL